MAIRPSRAAVLGAVQGPAELLPVSSSAHLTLIPWLADWDWDRQDPELRKSFEVALHAGAAAALLVGQRRVIAEELRTFDRRKAAVLGLSFLPAAACGVALERPIERHLGGPLPTALGLLIGAAAMAIADRRPRGRDGSRTGPVDGLALGLAQAAALAPGVSRNGATLTVARWRGFNREHANLLSRTVALPVIVAAAALKGSRLRRRGLPAEQRPAFLAGTAASFASTLASQALIRLVERDSSLCALRRLPRRARRDRPRPPSSQASAPPAGAHPATAGWRRRRALGAGPSVRVGGDEHERRPGPSEADPGRPYPGPDRMKGDAYARAGVSQDEADASVAALVEALAARSGGASRQVLSSGHYANVVRIDDRTGIALTTDGVGTKLLVAEQLGRWDTVGIDCVAMNVNDVICVGAEPLAMLDYLAVDRADRAVAAQIGEGLARGAALASIEIVGGELAQLGEIVNGLDLAGACFGTGRARFAGHRLSDRGW